MRAAIILLLAIVSSASPTYAAPPSPSPAPDTPADVAACVVDNDPRHVRILLSSTPGSPAETAAAGPVMQYYGGCNDNKAVNGTIAWRERAEIANAALLKRIGKASSDVAAAAAQPGWGFTLPSGLVAGTDYDSAAVGMQMLGDCIVRAAPQAAVDLARSDAGSVEEGVAIGRLSPALAPCVPAGQNMRVKRADLRLVVAEPLYHLVGR
jgi:hypothetical protein